MTTLTHDKGFSRAKRRTTRTTLEPLGTLTPLTDPTELFKPVEFELADPTFYPLLHKYFSSNIRHQSVRTEFHLTETVRFEFTAPWNDVHPADDCTPTQPFAIENGTARFAVEALISYSKSVTTEFADGLHPFGRTQGKPKDVNLYQFGVHMQTHSDNWHSLHSRIASIAMHPNSTARLSFDRDGSNRDGHELGTTIVKNLCRLIKEADGLLILDPKAFDPLFYDFPSRDYRHPVA